MATWRGLHINREGQITERYTRAVDQLGAVGDHGQEKIDVQLGGIYALERIAHDSPPDRPTIVEVLTAFVRQRATVAPRTEVPDDETGGPTTVGTLQARLPTVQAAMCVLGRMPRPAHVRLELSNVDLKRADLRGVNLTDATMQSADLTDANLMGANLSGAYLQGADLTNANLTGATLTRANLAGADLTNAFLLGADLSVALLAKANMTGATLAEANLTDAFLLNVNLTGAFLFRANLTDAQLAGANLTDVELEAAKLTDVRASDDTTWPAGFDPAAANVTIDDAPQ